MPAAETEAFHWRFFDFGDGRLALTSPRRRRASVRPAAEIARSFHPLPPASGAGGLALLEETCSLGSGALMSAGGRLVAESLAAMEPGAGCGPLRREKDGTWSARVWPLSWMQRLPGDFIYLRQSGDSDYGHWLLGVLPLVAVAAQFCDLSQFRIVVSRQPEAMARIMRDGLGLFGVAPGRIVALGEAPVFLQRAVYPLPLQRGSFVTPQALEVLESLPARLSGAADAPKRIYLAGGADRPVNEAALLELLRPLGFVAIEPGKMSFTEQIRAFSRAEIIVGASGAGLANMAVAPRGVRVIVPTPPGTEGDILRALVDGKQGYLVSLGGAAAQPADAKAGFSVDLAALRACLADLPP
jgi:capsular polysaccharide biosynthesis protein